VVNGRWSVTGDDDDVVIASSVAMEHSRRHPRRVESVSDITTLRQRTRSTRRGLLAAIDVITGCPDLAHFNPLSDRNSVSSPPTCQRPQRGREAGRQTRRQPRSSPHHATHEAVRPPCLIRQHITG